MKKWLACFLAMWIAVCCAACSGEESPSATAGDPVSGDAGETAYNGITILYTNDIRGCVKEDVQTGSLGYAALAAYKQELEDAGSRVVLVDGGGSLYGSPFSLLGEGRDTVSLMNETGYDFAVPGWSDLLWGVEHLQELGQQSRFTWLCCNLLEKDTGEPVFQPYRMITVGEEKVAFVGILSPIVENWFPGELENYSLCRDDSGQALYTQVQKTIDAALADGADTVVCIGATSPEPEETPWSVPEILANTTGMAVYLAGQSGYGVEGQYLTDSMDERVLLMSNRGDFTTFARIDLDLTELEAVGLLMDSAVEGKPAIEAYTQSLFTARMTDETVTVNRCNMAVDGIRAGETPLGNFCADSLRYALDADGAFLPGSAIHAGLPGGDVSLQACLDVFPNPRRICVVEATGREIMDALEYACRDMEQEGYDTWLHVSGITYRVDPAAPGSQKVFEVTVQGQPLDPEKTYRLAGLETMLCYGGEGYTLFADNKILTYPLMTDQDALVRYARSLEDISLLDYSEFICVRATISERNEEE